MRSVWIVVTALALMNIYVATSLRLKLSSISGAGAFIAAVFAAFFMLQLVVPLFDWNLALIKHEMDGAYYESLVRASYLALGVLSCLLVFTLVSDIVLLLLRFIISAYALRAIGIVLVVMVLVATAGSVFTGLLHAGVIEVVRVDLPLKNLPQPLEGFTIAQITDTHIGRFLKRDFVEKITKTVTQLNPDLVALTGDLADGYPENLAQELSGFADLKATYGKYYITGNHEYYWGAQAWIDEAKKLGFHVFTNENVVLEKNGAKLVIAGIPDPTSLIIGGGAGPNPVQAIAGAPEDSIKILLSHQPKFLEQAQQAGFNAQISGHTHAGQYFPFTKLIGFIQPYYKGLYNIGDLKLYVSKGTGFWGPPLREQDGEITLITLRRE